MTKLDNFDKLFVVWAFLFQILLIVHFAIRKPLFESYTVKYGWIIYALCIPAVVISIILLRGGWKRGNGDVELISEGDCYLRDDNHLNC